jgi:predicted nucleic acid-binding protein
MKLVVDPSLQLFGNSVLLHEYQRFAEQLNSDIITQILSELMAKVEIVKDTPDDALEQCLPYFSEQDAKDLFHTATCLQSGAILITNDRDFDRIRDAGIIAVWSIGDAIRKLSIKL